MNKKLFSIRLKELRKERGYATQSSLAKEYDKRYPAKRRNEAAGNEGDYRGFLGTLKNYENEEKDCDPKLTTVLNLCEILNCDIDYLTGAMQCHTRDFQFICDKIGLDECVVERITKEQGNVRLRILNALLQKEDFWDILNIMAIHSTTQKKLLSENERLSRQLRRMVKSGEYQDQVQSELFRRASIALDKQRYNYDLDKYECQIIFKRLVDGFLPGGNK